eukprot:SAG11_NODE_408_length_9704_cov_6.496774_12_plen_56_part_00
MATAAEFGVNVKILLLNNDFQGMVCTPLVSLERKCQRSSTDSSSNSLSFTNASWS